MASQTTRNGHLSRVLTNTKTMNTKKDTTDYSKHLVLYSGGADSTHFIQQNPSANHLLYYAGTNEHQKKVAMINANLLNRYLTIVPEPHGGRGGADGETNLIHSLYDTQMVLDAGIWALRFGMRGVVACFNADDLAIDFDAVAQILRRTEPHFELLTPLRGISAKKIRSALKSSKPRLEYVSCMHSLNCGFCAKCKRGY